MDDFLYNLRRESDKRNRKQSGQMQYRGPDRRGGKDQRRPYPKRYDSAEQSAEIKTLLETLCENQKRLIENDDRKIQALEDIAEALQSISGHSPSAKAKKAVKISVPAQETKAEAPQASEEESQAVADPPEVIEEAIEAAPGDAPAPEAEADAEQPQTKPLRSTHEDVRKIALSLRDQGKTFKEIARYLDDHKIPTFSGKGGWHAPTVHKLCK
jgi:hypothetical protein